MPPRRTLMVHSQPWSASWLVALLLSLSRGTHATLETNRDQDALVVPHSLHATGQARSLRQSRRRWLSLRSSSGVQCSLTEETYRFVLDPVSNHYVAYVPSALSGEVTTTATPDADPLERLHGIVRWNAVTVSATNATTTTTTTTPAFVEVRACSCLTRLSSREDFCPAHLNTCVVHGKYDPVSCYTRAPSDMMVRVVWTMSLVSIVLLGYAWWCTESGQMARRYLRRTCHYRNVWSTPHERHSSEQEAVRYLEHLVRHDPQRAAYMVRHYLLRERDRQRRDQAWRDTWCWATWWTLWSPVSSPSPEPAAGADETTHGAATHSASGVDTILPVAVDVPRPCLRLKVKVYRSKDDETSWSGKSGSASPTHAWGRVLMHHRNGTDLDKNGHHANMDVKDAMDVMDDETERGIRCAICLCRLRDGDRIGDIACCHVMHKDCLKDWLPRKNKCPLCQTMGIAILENGPPSPLEPPDEPPVPQGAFVESESVPAAIDSGTPVDSLTPATAGSP